jgi:hypothetical protein
MTKNRIRRALPALLATAVLSCGHSFESSKLGSEFHGIYRVDSFTSNTEGCDKEGASAAADDRDHFIVFAVKDGSGEWVGADLCPDVEKCRELRRSHMAEERTAVVTLFVEFRRVEATKMEGGIIKSGSPIDGTCRGAELTTALLSRTTPGAVSLEARTTLADFPADARGTCGTMEAKKATEGKACQGLRVVKATRVSDL